MQNSFPMREWHIKHMEKIVIKFVTGLSESATNWEKRQNKRYGRISNVCRQIAGILIFDMLLFQSLQIAS